MGDHRTAQGKKRGAQQRAPVSIEGSQKRSQSQTIAKICKHFKRLSNGCWECTASIRLQGPAGSANVVPGAEVRRGQTAGGVDWAAWLDEHCLGSKGCAE